MAGTTRELTILIAARNAAATVERAVRSCLCDTSCRIVLADDRSTDDTVARARAIDSRLHVVSTPDPGGVAAARQEALDAVDTPFAAWLDADDEWIPGRAERLVDMLRSGYSIATESIDLHDGPSGAWVRRLEAPSCLRSPSGAVRLFERNLLPGDTQVAFDVKTFRAAGGYDRSLSGPESYDLLLRALRNGATLGIGTDVGYRMYAFPSSLSRNLTRQRAALTKALRKHTYEDVRELYHAAGYDLRIAAWALVLMAQYRDEPSCALRYLDEASPLDADPLEILEPEGPWPLPEGWRRAFHRATILLALGDQDQEAEVLLRHAEALLPTAEGANNLGVALARLGHHTAAQGSFALAEARFPGYLDASINRSSCAELRITTHPLRRHGSRSE